MTFEGNPLRLVILLQSDGLVSLVAGVEGEERERDDDVPDVSGAALDGHGVLVVPLVSQTRGTAKDALGGLVTTSQPSRQIDDAGLDGWEKDIWVRVEERHGKV